MNVSDESKVIWIVSVGVWNGKVLDVQIKVIEKNLFIGSTSNGDGTADVCLYPSKEEYEKCGYDKQKVLEMIKKSSWHEADILRHVFGVTTLRYPSPMAKITASHTGKQVEHSEKAG